MDLPVLIFDGHWQSGSTVMKSEHRAHYRMLSPKSVYDCLMRDIYTSGLLEDSGTAHPVLPCTMEQVSVHPMGWKKIDRKDFISCFWRVSSLLPLYCTCSTCAKQLKLTNMHLPTMPWITALHDTFTLDQLSHCCSYLTNTAISDCALMHAWTKHYKWYEHD